MNDKELADAVVALGVGVADHEYYELELAPHRENSGRMTRYVKADEFVRDWRVYGALYQLKNPDADLRKMIEDLINA